MRWARGSTRDPPVRQEDVAAVHAADDGGRHCVDVEKRGRERVCVCVCAFAFASKACVFGKGTCSLSDTEGNAEVFAFVSVGVDTKANTFGRQAHLSDVIDVAEGSNLLNTIAPGTPTPLPYRLSSVMLFSRKETSGIPQKSVILACSSITLAK